MATTKKTNDSNTDEDVGEGETYILLVRLQNDTVTTYSDLVWRFFKRLKLQVLYDPAIPLLGINPKDSSQYTTKTETYTFRFTAGHKLKGFKSIHHRDRDLHIQVYYCPICNN